jgi:acyl carrier protein
MGSSAIMPLDSHLVRAAKTRYWHRSAHPLLHRNMSRAHSGIAVHIDDNDQVDATVRAVLHDVLGIDAGRVANFRSDTPLFGVLPELDSMAVAGLLTELEDRLGVLIEDDEVDGEMLETFGALVRFMTAKAVT